MQHVDLNSADTKVVLKRLNQSSRVAAVVEGAVNHIDAYDAERLLLQHRILVPHADMQYDLARLAHWLRLKPQTQPAVSFVGTLMVTGGHSVRKDKKCGSIAANRRKPLKQ